MKWEFSALDKFLQHEEYIDTALIPLVKLDLGSDFAKALSWATWLTGICHAVEEQLTGRVMLFPAYTYVQSIPMERIREDISATSSYFKQHNFKHVVYVYIENEEEEPIVEKDSDTFHTLAIAPPMKNEEEKWEIAKQLMEKEAQKLVPQLINLWQK